MSVCIAEAQNGVLRMSLQQEVPSHMFTLPRVWEQVWHYLHRLSRTCHSRPAYVLLEQAYSEMLLGSDRVHEQASLKAMQYLIQN